MKSFFSLIVLILSINICFGQNYANKLLGTWQYSNQNGKLVLIFQNKTQLLFDNSPGTYTANAKTIRVFADGQYVNYPYVLKNSILTIRFPEGYQIHFKRSSAKTSNKLVSNGKEGLLIGTLCSYHGSSSSYSSYSSTTRVYFDGRGNFQYKSETSFSSSAGAYDNGNTDCGSGKYIVQSNRIILYFSDGSTEYAQIYFRQSNGSISEIKYDGTLYSKALCE